MLRNEATASASPAAAPGGSCKAPVVNKSPGHCPSWGVVVVLLVAYLLGVLLLCVIAVCFSVWAVVEGMLAAEDIFDGGWV